MTVELRTLTLDECQLVREWRNAPDVLPMLRTNTPLTKAQQATFFRDVVSNPNADHRYYAVVTVDRGGQETFIGMGGLTYVSRQPGEAELSLIIGPEFRGKRLGLSAACALVVKARSLNIRCLIGECYRSGHVAFWRRVVDVYQPAAGGWYDDTYWFWILTGVTT